MKIAVISSTILTCPPLDKNGKPAYGGLEVIAFETAKGLGKLGHKVLLVAPKGSLTPENVELHTTTQGEPENFAARYGYIPKLKDYDVIIDDSWQHWSVLAKLEGHFKAPVLQVFHAPINTMLNSLPPMPKPCFVCISEDQAQSMREHIKGSNPKVVHNGIDLNFYKPINLKRNNRYLFLARFSGIKGPDICINAARNCAISLDLVGDVTITNEPQLYNYCKEQTMAYPKARIIGNQTREECVYWFNKNKALLHTNERFREPLGLTMLESQACGMPAIAFDNGACRELIKHNETGFLVKTQKELEDLIKSDAVSSIKPERCRENASQFSIEKMVKRYEQLCIEAIDTGGW